MRARILDLKAFNDSKTAMSDFLLNADVGRRSEARIIEFLQTHEIAGIKCRNSRGKITLVISARKLIQGFIFPSREKSFDRIRQKIKLTRIRKRKKPVL